MQMKMQLKNDRGGEKVTWSCGDAGDCWRQRRQQGWWRLLATAEAAEVVVAPFLLLSLCFLLCCFFSVSAIFLCFSARHYWWLWRGRSTVALPS
jgi:hypothetical protein